MSPASDDFEGIVHDLNNVFETISQAAEVLAADEDKSAVAAAILRSVERGRRIVSDLADPRGITEVRGMVEAAIQFTRDYLENTSRPPLEFRCGVDSHLRLRGTPCSWERVLVNLLVNSSHAVESASMVVEIEARAAGPLILLTVQDNGTGIPEDILPLIFQPHFSTRATPGMGLHVVESIVNKLGGSVSAGNRTDGRGAIFHIQAMRA